MAVSKYAQEYDQLVENLYLGPEDADSLEVCVVPLSVLMLALYHGKGKQPVLSLDCVSFFDGVIAGGVVGKITQEMIDFWVECPPSVLHHPMNPLLDAVRFKEHPRVVFEQMIEMTFGPAELTKLKVLVDARVGRLFPGVANLKASLLYNSRFIRVFLVLFYLRNVCPNRTIPHSTFVTFVQLLDSLVPAMKHFKVLPGNMVSRTALAMLVSTIQNGDFFTNFPHQFTFV
jgi:hypothetical protein